MAEPIPKYYGPIAVLDMLGFRKFVETNSLDDVISNYAHVITGASFTSEVLKEELQFMVYSDTIAIRLVNQSERGFYNFIHALKIISSNYFYECQISGNNPLPIRGAIAFGEYSWHIGNISTQVIGRKQIYANNINFIVGQAVLDAHQHESIQQWIGISMNNKTAEVIKNLYPNAFNALIRDNLLIEYNIPKELGSINGFVVNSTIRAVFKDSFSAFLNKCEFIFHCKEEDYKTKLKYFNTMLFQNDLHQRDFLHPSLGTIPNDERKALMVEVDKTKYNELIKYFEDHIKKPETRNPNLELETLNLELNT